MAGFFELGVAVWTDHPNGLRATPAPWAYRRFFNGLQQGFFLKAIAVYKQILKLDPSRLEAQVHLGEMYEQLQLISDAMTVFEDVSNAFARAGDSEQALAMLGKIVDIDPEWQDPDTRLNRIRGMVEKPQSDPPSNKAIIGRPKSRIAELLG